MPDFDDILDEAQNMTDKQLADKLGEIAKSLDYSDIMRLFPSEQDRRDLYKLITIIKKSTSDNMARKELMDNIASYAKIVVSLVKLFV